MLRSLEQLRALSRRLYAQLAVDLGELGDVRSKPSDLGRLFASDASEVGSKLQKDEQGRPRFSARPTEIYMPSQSAAHLTLHLLRGSLRVGELRVQPLDLMLILAESRCGHRPIRVEPGDGVAQQSSPRLEILVSRLQLCDFVE